MRQRRRVGEYPIHQAIGNGKRNRQPNDQKRGVVFPRPRRFSGAACEKKRRENGVGRAEKQHLPVARHRERIKENAEKWRERGEQCAASTERALGGSEDAWRGEEQLEREEQRRDPECDKKRAAVEAETNAFDRRGCHHECPHDEGRRETHLPGFGGSCHA